MSDAPIEPAQIETGDSPVDAPVTLSDLTRAVAGQLFRLSTGAQVGLILLGGLLAFSRSPQALRPGASVPVALGLIAEVGLAIVVGLVVGHFLRGMGALLLAQAELAEATGRLGESVAKGLEQLPRLIEGMTLASQGAEAPRLDSSVTELVEIRVAVRAGKWEEAGRLVRAFVDARPDAPESPRILEEYRVARQSAAEDLLTRLEVAREVNDPDRVLELRDELRPLLDHEPLRTLDRDLARWFMILIQKRLRAGTVRADVAVLAGRVAASLDDTAEGASLRASLPTLRRAAGLCAKCAEPYRGTANVCPTCVAAARPGTPQSPPSTSLDEQAREPRTID